MTLKPLLFLPLLWLVACNSSDGGAAKPDIPSAPDDTISGDNMAIPDNTARDEYKILLFGNSHIVGLSTVLSTLISHGLPGKLVTAQEASSQRYLDERLSDGVSKDMLQSDNWTHVILQAQKYSQSGTVDYSTTATQTWSQLAKAQQATPVLFPEHPQRGNNAEGKRVYELHRSIADKQAACVAPVGPVWDKVIALRPDLVLHHADGNHASDLGKLLTALIFYQLISGNSADLLPYIVTLNVDRETQDFLGQIVSQVLAEYPACQY